MFTMRVQFCLLATCLLACSPSAAFAVPFNFTATLTGDPRPANPDDLEVIVSVLGDTTSTVTYWTVDLNMTAEHPDARLDQFGFNLLGARSNYTFGSFNLPYTPTTGSLNGSGGTTFLLTLDDPSGHRSDATNIRTLSFTVTKNSTFSMDDFLLAPVSCSNDTLLGCNQLGAHLQALAGGASGVAVGDYPTPPPPPPPPAPVPEPASLVLVAAGALLGASRFRARERRA